MNIENYSFEYTQLGPIQWLCLILHKESNNKFGIKFTCPPNIDPRQDNNQVFKAFCDKKTFNEKFFIEAEIVKEQPAPVEHIKIEIKESDNTPQIEKAI